MCILLENIPLKSIRLQRTLGICDLVSYGMTRAIASGIFIVTGKAIRDNSGAAIFLAYIFAAVVAFVSGICYAELSARLPVSGTAYTYTYATLGYFYVYVNIFSDWVKNHFPNYEM